MEGLIFLRLINKLAELRFPLEESFLIYLLRNFIHSVLSRSPWTGSALATELRRRPQLLPAPHLRI